MTATPIDLTQLMASEFHELKNQLGQLTLVLRDTAGAHPEMAEALSEPRMICHRISDRLVQVLTLYKSGQDSLSLNIEAHSPADFIEEMRVQAASLAGRRLTLETRCEKAPPFWFFDRYLTEMALLNALHNALQYAREHLVLSAEASDGGLLLQVRDDSAGYPAHILENQGREPGQNVSGTGLGLYFARVIAQAHENNGRHGDIRLSNEDGAVFSLWLP